MATVRGGSRQGSTPGFLTLANTTALHACTGGEEKKRRGYGASRRDVGHQ
jgi:hypothetical protein